MVIVRKYRGSDEEEWLICRFLCFLDTPFWDDVVREKPRYGESVELVAQEGKGGSIVGVLDVEVEEAPKGSAEPDREPSAQIMTLGVLPTHRRRGIASQMLYQAEGLLSEMGVERIEAWTRDDPIVNLWYQRRGFSELARYRHVYLSGNEHLSEMFPKGVTPVHVFLHVTDPSSQLEGFDVERAHACIGYAKSIPRK